MPTELRSSYSKIFANFGVGLGPEFMLLGRFNLNQNVPLFPGRGKKKTTSAGTGGSGQFGAFVYKYKSGKIIDDKLRFSF